MQSEPLGWLFPYLAALSMSHLQLLAWPIFSAFSTVKPFAGDYRTICLGALAIKCKKVAHIANKETTARRYQRSSPPEVKTPLL
ncbi:hypothetical protein BJX99DRAFT_56652 [Aspergillus californicus]